MWVSKITEENLTNDMVDCLLFEGLYDCGEKVDCVLVLGSSKAVKYRVPVAARVYLEGRAKKIMMCGGIVANMPEETISEAERMKKKP